MKYFVKDKENNIIADTESLEEAKELANTEPEAGYVIEDENGVKVIIPPVPVEEELPEVAPVDANGYVPKTSAPFPTEEKITQQKQQYQEQQHKLSKKERKAAQQAAAQQSAKEQAEVKTPEPVTPVEKKIEEVKKETVETPVAMPEIPVSPAKGKIYIGAPLVLKEERLFKGLGVKFIKKITGTVYLFDETPNNGYIRVTNNVNHAVNHTVAGIIGTVSIDAVKAQYEL